MKALIALKEGQSIDSVCREYNTSLVDLIEQAKLTYKVRQEEYENDSQPYLFKQAGRWIIARREKGGHIASFFDEKEAKEVLRELVETDFKNCKDVKYLGDKYIRTKNDVWIIETRNPHGNFGTYKTNEDARKVRNELYLCDFDKSQLDNILKRLGVKQWK